MSTTPDDDLDLTLARRRRHQKRAAGRRRLVVVVGLLAVLAVAAGVGLAVAVRNRTAKPGEVAAARPPLIGGPSPTSEGDTWDHNELAAYLRSRGVQLHSETTRRESLAGPACLFMPAEGDEEHEVHVLKWPDRQTAKDRAAGYPQPAFAWGRFVLHGRPASEPFAASIRSALGVR